MSDSTEIDNIDHLLLRIRGKLYNELFNNKYFVKEFVNLLPSELVNTYHISRKSIPLYRCIKSHTLNVLINMIKIGVNLNVDYNGLKFESHRPITTILIYSLNILEKFEKTDKPDDANEVKKMIFYLIDQKACINVIVRNGMTALAKAIIMNKYDIASKLLENGADPNFKIYGVEPILHYCVILNKIDMIQLLLKNGANPYLSNSHGQTFYSLSDLIPYTKKLLDQLL